MSLPYENTTSGERAVADMQKVLRKFGCGKFGSMMDFNDGFLLVQFEYRNRHVSVKASVKGYAAAWLKEHPLGQRSRTSKLDHERAAMEVGAIAVYSIVRDWIKSQVAIVETGVLSFEGAFLGQILLSGGKTGEEYAKSQKLLPVIEEKVTAIGKGG